MSGKKFPSSQRDRHRRKQAERRRQHEDKYQDEVFKAELRRLAAKVNTRRSL